MTQWVFIVGFCDKVLDAKGVVVKTAEQNYQGLQDFIQKYYTDRLPKGTPFFTSRWNNDVVAEINAKYPTGDLGIFGFSFGGQKTIEVINALAPRRVKKAVFFDPVNIHDANVPNVTGFTPPATVDSITCYYCATPAPGRWSGHFNAVNSTPCPMCGLTHPLASDLTQIKYTPTTVDPHGEWVWKFNFQDPAFKKFL